MADAKATEEPFFADESAHEGPKAAAAEPEAVAEPAASEATSMEMPSIEPGIVEEEPAPIEAVSPVVEVGHVAGHEEESADYDVAPVEVNEHEAQSSVEVAPEPAPEIWERVEETTPSERDPYLVVPEAVHVTPEPLLLDEADETEPSHSEYRDRHEAAPVAGTFEIAASPEPAVEEERAEETPLPEPSFELAAPENAALEHEEERVVTGPPPNRAALAEIPFLNPPLGFDPDARPAPMQPAATGADASTVDAVVEKLLERLQPQLHELLSQGVLKPLVENLLQQEASKKQK